MIALATNTQRHTVEFIICGTLPNTSTSAYSQRANHQKKASEKAFRDPGNKHHYADHFMSMRTVCFKTCKHGTLLKYYKSKMQFQNHSILAFPLAT